MIHALPIFHIYDEVTEYDNTSSQKTDGASESSL